MDDDWKMSATERYYNPLIWMREQNEHLDSNGNRIVEIKSTIDLELVGLTCGNFHELSRRSGLSRSTVSGVLQGKRGASLDTLRKLSEASGVELGKLVEYVESQQRQRRGRSK